ncbi:MAG: alkaline phosphatase D, partial [Verrucomicrobiales bacterium]
VGSRADLILLLGDDHYADTTQREGQSTAYFSHRSKPGFRSITTRIPTYNIWDDHDYGPNDSDGTADGKETSLATFKDFWPNPSYGETDNPGVYYKFSRADVDFFMLDVRYHRSPDKMIDDGSKTMLGARQLQWLKRELKSSTGKVKIIASGSEWQRNSHTDSWSSYPREREEVFGFIENENITGVLLISGDRHFTGGYQIGGKLIEVTSGPLGSKNFPTKNLPDMFLNYGEGKLYCVFDIDTTKDEPKVILEVHRAGDGIVEKMPLPWKAILGEEKIETLPVQVTPKKPPFQVPFGE